MIYDGMYVCRGPKSVGGNTWAKRAHAQSLEKMVATELLQLAVETDEERKARLKKTVATTQLRLAPETED